MSYSFSRFLSFLQGKYFISEPRALPFNKNNVRFLQGSSASSAEVSQFSGNVESFLKSAMSQNSRWFDNPYPDFTPGGSQANMENVRKLAIAKADEAFEKGLGSGDGGVYVGAVGCTYMLLHILDKLTEEERQKYIPLAINAYQIQSIYFKQNSTNRTDECAFLLGKAGHYAVGAILGQVADNKQLTDECLQRFSAAANICKPVDFFRHGGDELLVGRAGYLCGALWLQQKLGYQPVPKEDLRDVWNAMIESGKRYSKSNKSPCPLMYSYYEIEYLGAAHGLSGILQIILSFPVFLKENHEASDLVKATVEFYLSLQDESGNFPCDMDETGKTAQHVNDMLVHWCHGAPGAIYLLAKAYMVYKEQKYLDACVKCGELMWTKGLIRKGPGICHGVAGNGYVFLIINQLLKESDPKQLYRAGKFGEFLQHPKFLREARRPDSPHSLYEGWAGTVCYLMDLLQPETAEFPFFNLKVEYNG